MGQESDTISLRGILKQETFVWGAVLGGMDGWMEGQMDVLEWSWLFSVFPELHESLDLSHHITIHKKRQLQFSCLVSVAIFGAGDHLFSWECAW